MAKKDTAAVVEETALATQQPWFMQQQAATVIPDSPIEPPKPFVSVAPTVQYNRKEGSKNTQWFVVESRQNSRGQDKVFFVDSPDLPAKTNKMLIAPIMITKRAIAWSTDEAKPGPLYEHPSEQGPFPDFEGKLDNSYRMIYWDVERDGLYMIEGKNLRAQREFEMLHWQMVQDARKGIPAYHYQYLLYTYANQAKSDMGTFTNHYPRFKRMGDDLMAGTRAWDQAEGPVFAREAADPKLKAKLDKLFSANPPSLEGLAVKLFTLNARQANDVANQLSEGKITPEEALAVVPEVFRATVNND